VNAEGRLPSSLKSPMPYITQLLLTEPSALDVTVVLFTFHTANAPVAVFCHRMAPVVSPRMVQLVLGATVPIGADDDTAPAFMNQIARSPEESSSAGPTRFIPSS